MKLPVELGVSRLSSSPLEVRLKRNSSVESVHRVHAAVCDSKGRILMRAGNSSFETFIRSALKPFQALPFLSSGAAEKQNCGERGLAICCSSHNGSTIHAREVFKILWNAEVEVNCLQCPIPKNANSPLEHNCSGKHAGFLATCKKMGWALNNYLEIKHPLHREVNRRIADLLKLPAEELVAARDDCGAPTLLLQLNQMALLYAKLGESTQADHVQITRSMLLHPDLIAGDKLFDTELMRRSHGQFISKGGAEGIQCLSRIGEGIGVAIKVEDGSRRAKQAVALHILGQLEWLSPAGLEEMEEQVLFLNTGVKLEVIGKLGFQEN